MSDERVNEKSLIQQADGVTDQAYFVSRQKQQPRFVKLTFKQAAYNAENININNVISAGAQIMYEDAPFNQNTSAIKVADTVADQRAYLVASASNSDLFFDNKSLFDSTMLDESHMAAIDTSNSKSFIFNALKNIQSAGYQYAKTDASDIVRSDFLNDIKGFSASISLSNLFISDIVENIISNETTIFADEFASTKSKAKQIQKKSRISTNTFVLSAEDYDLTIPYYEYELLDAVSVESTDVVVTHVGFAIEKYGQNIDGSLKIYDTFYLDAGSNDLYDYEVRYGGLYTYVVRSIFQITIYAAVVTNSGTSTQIAKTKMLFGTSGKNNDVFCIEETPPPAPDDVYFRLLPTGDLFIGWKFPFNKQRDIKKFQVFRRKTLQESFELIKQLDFDDSIVKSPNIENVPSILIEKHSQPTCLFVDKTFNVNSKFIYAIASIDAHGYSSNYSTQYEVNVNLYTESLIIKAVVRKDCPKPYPNLYINQDFFVDLVKDSNHTKMSIFLDPDYSDMYNNAGKKLGIMAFNNKRASYKLHILETNLAQDQILDITLKNEKLPVEIPASEAKVYTQVR